MKHPIARFLALSAAAVAIAAAAFAQTPAQTPPRADPSRDRPNEQPFYRFTGHPPIRVLNVRSTDTPDTLWEPIPGSASRT